MKSRKKKEKVEIKDGKFLLNGRIIGGHDSWGIRGGEFTISDFGLDEKYRRKGYGTRFYKLLEKKAIMMGCKTIWADEALPNGRIFWEKLGFKEEIPPLYLGDSPDMMKRLRQRKRSAYRRKRELNQKSF